MSLNKSVITGKCSGCAAYREELVEAQEKLAHWELGSRDEDCPYLTERNEAWEKLEAVKEKVQLHEGCYHYLGVEITRLLKGGV